jgi:hypothetical protein
MKLSYSPIEPVQMEYKSEYISLSNKLYDKLVGELRQSFPNACVLYIKRIVNPELLTRYEEFVKNNDVTEMRLFHGTKAGNISSICARGYLQHLNRHSAYGKGTYFAAAGSMSEGYTDSTENGESYMFMNRVAVTASTGGDRNVGIYVLKHDEAAYPEYLISFHKNARV